MLKELKINLNSKFPTLKLADGGIINTLWINPLNELNAKNLENLTDFQYDGDIINTLHTLCIQNCPSLNDFGYLIAKGEKIAKYCFNDINWSVPAADWATDTSGEPTVAVLDNLLKEGKGFVEVTTSNLALTGNLTIEVPSKETLNEYTIYSKYIKHYPNLQITYTGDGIVSSAPTITFYNSVETAEDGKTITGYKDIIYQVKTNGTYELAWLVSTAGPTGTAITSHPTKDSDKIYDYTWTGNWYIIENDIIIQTITDEEMKALTPKADMIFAAEFSETKHPYVITLRDYDGSNIEHSIGTQVYGTDITNLMPFYMYRIHNASGMRYEF